MSLGFDFDVAVVGKSPYLGGHCKQFLCPAKASCAKVLEDEKEYEDP